MNIATIAIDTIASIDIDNIAPVAGVVLFSGCQHSTSTISQGNSYHIMRSIITLRKCATTAATTTIVVVAVLVVVLVAVAVAVGRDK